jgi:hypothetical protein
MHAGDVIGIDNMLWLMLTTPVWHSEAAAFLFGAFVIRADPKDHKYGAEFQYADNVHLGRTWDGGYWCPHQ